MYNSMKLLLLLCSVPLMGAEKPEDLRKSSYNMIKDFKSSMGYGDDENRVFIVNEKDPMRVISIKGETIIYIANNYIEVTLKEKDDSESENSEIKD